MFLIPVEHLKSRGGVGGGGRQPPHDIRTSDDSIRGAFLSMAKVQKVAGGWGRGGSRAPMKMKNVMIQLGAF